jgi:signal recognition particle subunit SRP54
VQPQLRNEGNVWMLVGLQGAGKTTTAGKLAYKYKAQGRRPLLVAADTQRPAAREQLRILGRQIGVPVLEVGDGESVGRDEAPARRGAAAGLPRPGHRRHRRPLADRRAADGRDGRAARRPQPTERILVVDAMTGQQSLPVAKSFDERVGITGLILSKMDGDARGGAALSAKHVTGKPILFAGMSEKIDGLEAFHPDRIAGRILGMGDVLTLIEKAKALEGDDDGTESGRMPTDFSLADMLTQMRRIKQMGSFTDVLSMIPGAGKLLPPGAQIDEREIARVEAIISSMTERERREPRLLNASRRKRIARGSGTTVQDVNRLMKNYEEMRTLMKRMGKRPPGRGGRGQRARA